MTLDDLLAREAIRDLVTRYNSYGDSGRFEQLLQLFTESAVMEIVDRRPQPAVYAGLEHIRHVFTDAADQVSGGERGDDASPRYIRHFTATHQIDLTGADHATGRCYFAVLMASGLDHWGRYLDEYVRAGREWKFARRRVVVDGRAPTSRFAV